MKGKKLTKTTLGKYLKNALKRGVGFAMYSSIEEVSGVKSVTCACDGGCGKKLSGNTTTLYVHGNFCVCEKCYDPEKDYATNDWTVTGTVRDKSGVYASIVFKNKK